jgi:hypothetical protein
MIHFLPYKGVRYPRWYRYAMVAFWFWIAIMFALSAFVRLVKAEERFGAGAAWVHHMADGSTEKYSTENGCWHAHFSQEILTGSYCEPDKEWLLVEMSEVGADTTGFKSELGCFMSGVIASHQQGVEAQCMYIGGKMADGVPRRGRSPE